MTNSDNQTGLGRRTFLKAVGAGLAGVAVGCIGEPKVPIREDYAGHISITYIDGLGNCWIEDLDKDGTADEIRRQELNVTLYRNSDYTGPIKGTTKPQLGYMTPEIKDAASRFLRAKRDLEFAIAKRQYERVIKNQGAPAK